VAERHGLPGGLRIDTVPLEQALVQARAAGTSEDLDCLLCDEVADPRPAEALLGRFLTPLDVALATAIRGSLGAT